MCSVGSLMWPTDHQGRHFKLAGIALSRSRIRQNVPGYLGPIEGRPHGSRQRCDHSIKNAPEKRQLFWFKDGALFSQHQHCSPVHRLAISHIESAFVRSGAKGRPFGDPQKTA
jgi:hypothetical protein